MLYEVITRNILIALEPVNRYETYLVNTCEQALYLRELIGRDNVKVHLDTYHMNIEEKDFYEATVRAGKHLIHYHLCENDRGVITSYSIHYTKLYESCVS